MGILSFLQSARRVLKTATKPGRKELWITIRFCLLAFAVVGTIAFIIHFISVMIRPV